MNNEDFDADFFAELDAPDDDFFAELDAPASGPFSQTAPAAYTSTPAAASTPSGPFGGTISADNSRTGLGQPARFGGMLRKPVAGSVEVVRDILNKGTDANIGDAWDRGVALSDNEAEKFRKESPKTAAVADSLSDLGLIVGTGGLGGGALGTSIASRLPAATPAIVSRALPMAAGGAVTGGAMGFSERGDLGDAVKGAGIGTVAGTAGALAPVATAVVGGGLAVGDAVDALQDGDAYRATRAITDLGLDLGLGIGGSVLKNRLANHVEAERKLSDYEAMAREPIDTEIRKKEQDLRTSRGNLEAAQEKARIIPEDDSVDKAFRKDVADLEAEAARREEKLANIGNQLEVAQARQGESAHRQGTQREVLEAQLAQQQAREAAQRRRELEREARRALETAGKQELAAANAESNANLRRGSAEFDERIAQARLDALDNAEAAAIKAMQESGGNVEDPAVIRARAAVEQAIKDMSDDVINKRVSQKELKLYADRFRRVTYASEVANMDLIDPAIRERAQQAFQEQAQVGEDALRRLVANEDALAKLAGREDPEVLQNYRDKVKAEAETNLKVAEARLAKVLERKATKEKPLSPVEARIKRLVAEKAEWVAQQRQAMNDPEAASTRARLAKDPMEALSPEAAHGIMRSLGYDGPPADAKTMLAQMLDARFPMPERAPSAAEVKLSALERRPNETAADVRLRQLQAMQQALQEAPILSPATNPWSRPELQEPIRQLAAKYGIDPSQLSESAFAPGASPFRASTPAATMPDLGREVFYPGQDLPANAPRQANLREQFNLQERIRGQEADLAEARAALADLLGPNEEGRRILQQLQDQQSVDFSLTGVANFLKDRFASAAGRGAAARLAARNPKAAVYFYRDLARQMAVPDSVIERYAGLILAEGISAAERTERLIYAINQALNQQS